jgi:hypothetical protein
MTWGQTFISSNVVNASNLSGPYLATSAAGGIYLSFSTLGGGPTYFCISFDGETYGMPQIVLDSATQAPLTSVVVGDDGEVG